MFIHKRNKLRQLSLNSYNKEKYINAELHDFFKEIIVPNKINQVIGIYIIFDNEIDLDTNLFVKNAIEEYLDYGFMNITQLENNSLLIIRFNVEYENICDDLKKLIRKLSKNNISLKCSVNFEDKQINIEKFHAELVKRAKTPENKNTVISTNYYIQDFLKQKNNPLR